MKEQTDAPTDAAMSQLDVCSERLEAAVRQVARQNRRIAALTARLAAAEAVVAAIKARRTNGMLRQGSGKDDEHAITLALATYDALAGTEEG